MPKTMLGFFKPGQSPALGSNKLEHLKYELKGALFPLHTRLFIDRTGGSEGELVKAIMDDNLNEVNKLNTNMSRDDFKELLLIAAFMGANDVFTKIKESKGFSLDDDIVNTALLSGRLDPDIIKGLVHGFHAGYGSIRYAIKSDKLPVVENLMGANRHLHFGEEHLTQAAAQGSVELFLHIKATGVEPKGKFIHSVAQNYPEIKKLLDEKDAEATVAMASPGAGGASSGSI